MKINSTDKKLIEQAKEVVLKNADLLKPQRELVASIVLGKSGKVYEGVNIKTSHSICAEQVALGHALACGEREIDTVVAVILNADGSTNVVAPCGVCRYTFERLGMNVNVIVRDVEKNEILKVKVKDLLPYQYNRK